MYFEIISSHVYRSLMNEINLFRNFPTSPLVRFKSVCLKVISYIQNDSSEVELTTTTECSMKTVDGVSTLPVCLQDILINSLSFLRTAMWFENGRWRQWEALDCANLDPVHIDFHRIIPYMIFYPGKSFLLFIRIKLIS